MIDDCDIGKALLNQTSKAASIGSCDLRDVVTYISAPMWAAFERWAATFNDSGCTPPDHEGKVFGTETVIVERDDLFAVSIYVNNEGFDPENPSL